MLYLTYGPYNQPHKAFATYDQPVYTPDLHGLHGQMDLLTSFFSCDSHDHRYKMALVACLCGAKFSGVTTLHVHATEKGHSYKCDSATCGALFRSANAAKDHQKSVNHDNPIVTLDLLQESNLAGKAQEAASLKCAVCVPNKKPFKDAASLSQHTADKHPNHSTCPTCQQTFEARSQRLGHQKDSRMPPLDQSTR